MSRAIILCFSCEPGGAEVLIPVIRLLHADRAYRVIVLSYGLGATRFAGKGIECIEIGPVAKDDLYLIEQYRPDLIISSATSLPERDMSEKHLWHNARRQGVPTLAFIDQWQNYAPRFSGATPQERLAYLPDYINCIDDLGEAEMLREGFQPHLLTKFGHPYLSGLEKSSAAVDAARIKADLGFLPGQNVPLFVSEAIREHYGRDRGYDQYDAFRLFLELCLADGDTAVLVKVHPKDCVSGYQRVAAGYGTLKASFVSDALSPAESLAVADRVYGMTSIMLIEAYVLGKPVVSIQPGLLIEDPLMLSRHGLIERIETLGGKRGEFVPLEAAHFSYGFDAARFLAFLKELLDLPADGRVAAGNGSYAGVAAGN